MGKESEKEWIYVYIKRNLFVVHLKLTQHCESTIPQYKIKIKFQKKKSYREKEAPAHILWLSREQMPVL